jgi:hypothetical protein
MDEWTRVGTVCAISLLRMPWSQEREINEQEL